MAGADGIPVRRQRLAVEAGEDDAALRQAGNHAQQLGHLGDAAGHTGGDHGRARRVLLPALDPGREQAVAALDRVDAALLRHDVRPDLGQDAQELQGLLPMLGKLGRDQAVESLQGHVLGRDLVEEAHQLAGEADRLLVLDLAVLGEDELGEQEVAAQRRQGGEQLKLGLRVEQELVGLELAHGLEARKEQGATACGPHHRVAQGEAGAPARQEDQRVGQGHRPGAATAPPPPHPGTAGGPGQ